MEQIDRNKQMITSLETFLVSEFRAYQTLLKLSRQEREALIKADVLSLAGTVEQKDALMVEIRRLQQDRSQSVRAWAQTQELSVENPSLRDILPYVPQDAGQRMKRIRSGILAISQELQDLTHGNQALAASALERIDNMRTLILSFDQPADHYIATGEKKSSMNSASLKLEERA